MRTALILLFLLALASVPGSVLPQEGIDPAAVTQYYTAHPGLAPFLNKLSLFNVFAAPWFAAIYLLLFASLAGCVLPRTFRLAVSARQRPPRAPRTWPGCRPARPTPRPCPRPQALRVGREPARPPPVPAEQGRRLGLSREGLPARGRQPAVPHRTAGPVLLGRDWRHLRLQGQPAAGRRPGLRQHADRAGCIPARQAGQP